MNILGSVITAGVIILAVALLTYAVGKTLVSLPTFTNSGAEQQWYTTMSNVSINAGTAFSILSISPLVLGAAVIISILIGAFVMYQVSR
jgi:hypothetical protein